MEQYLPVAQPLLVRFKHIEVTHLPRSENQMENALATSVSNALYPCNVELSVKDSLSIPSVEVMAIDHQVEMSWMTPISEYLKNGALLENWAKLVKVKAQASRYSLVNDVLYRRSFSGPYLRCIP